MGSDVEATGWNLRPGGPSGGAYVIEGVVLEASRQPRSRTRLTERSLSAWQITSGLIDGVDVSGQVVLVIQAGSAGLDGSPIHLMLLDEQVTPEQKLALVDAFQGRLGGPFAPNSANHEGWAMSQVPIECNHGPGRLDISVPDRVRLVARFSADGGDGESPGEADAADVSVDLGEHGLTWDELHAPAVYRRFHVQTAER